MPKQVWISASVLTAVVFIGLLGLSSWTKNQNLKAVTALADQLAAQLEEAQATLAQREAEAAALQHKLTNSQVRIGELEKEKEAVTHSQKSLEQEMRAALESKDVTISQLQGRLTVNILDRILFNSGEADLKSDGEAVLQKVATILGQHPHLKIHVIGHTDNVPIKAGARSRFASNWELSTTRATAAVRFLTEKAGVDPHRLGAVGYGEFRPIADNATPEGRAKNRRIAITILSEELAGSDAVPTATPGRPAEPAAPAPAKVEAPAPASPQDPADGPVPEAQ
jgi:chemotaxis protein MotB